MANTIRIPVPDVAYARVSLPEIDINDNPYEAVEGAAAGIAGALLEREARDDEEFLSKAVADLNDAAANHITDSMHNGTVGPGYATSLNDALEARFKYWESQTDKPRLRQALRRRYAGMRPQMLDLGLRTEADGRAQGAVDTSVATMQGLAQVAYYRPDQIGDVRERARELRGQYPEYGPAFDRQEQVINEAYLRGLIATNPKLALETLRNRRGHDAEDLGIPEPLREVFEHEAELAIETEIDGQTAAQEQERIALSLSTAASLAAARFDTGIPYDVYQPVRDAYKVDPKTGSRLEVQVDEAHAVATRRAERHNSVARALVERRAVKWNAERLESLDTFVDTVANDGSGEATANERRIRMAIIAGVMPPRMQGHILKSLRATDPATRTGGLRMLQKLEEADETGGLTAWLPADQRATAQRFAALTAAGYADAEALQNLDAAKSSTPSLEEARRHHFDTYVRMDDLIDAAGRLYNIEPEGIAEDDRQTLEYRSDVDATGPLGKRGQHDRAPIETDIDKQWPGADLQRRPKYRGKRYRHDVYRKR